MIATFVSAACLFALVHGSPDATIGHLKHDFLIKEKSGNHRLSGILMKPSQGRCELVRPKIKTFGYCYIDENEQKNINTTKERAWVREAIQQWEKCGGIKILEEPKCRSGPDFITIKIGNYHPVVYPGVDTKICKIIDFTMFNTFFTDNIQDYVGRERVRESMIKMYFLHEFGHFLGFDHEHNRSDRKDECDTPVDQTHVGPDAAFGDYAISKDYDLESIMNYCRPQVHYKPWLSDLDKKTVRQVYGGGNQAECDAVTKPWKWAPGQGLDDWTLNALGGITAKPVPTTPKGCFDDATTEVCTPLARMKR